MQSPAPFLCYGGFPRLCPCDPYVLSDPYHAREIVGDVPATYLVSASMVTPSPMRDVRLPSFLS